MIEFSTMNFYNTIIKFCIAFITLINFEENKFSYPLLAELGNGTEIIPKLEDLSSETAGILERGIYERLPLCPDHPENLATTVRLYCSSCLSDDIKKMHLQEHKACGFINVWVYVCVCMYVCMCVYVCRYV